MAYTRGMVKMVIHTSIAAAILLHTLIGCCHHNVFAGVLLHAAAAKANDHGHPHPHGHSHEPFDQAPVEHEDHDCACQCEWLNNIQILAAPVLALSLDVPLDLAMTSGGDLIVAEAASYRASKVCFAPPVRAHLALCRLLL